MNPLGMALLRWYPSLLNSTQHDFSSDWTFWVGGNGTTTSMHFDSDEFNFLYVVYGRKRLVLLPQDSAKYRCKTLFTHHSCWTGMDVLTGPRPEGAFETHLRSGQGVLIPRRCWHAAENLEPTIA